MQSHSTWVTRTCCKRQRARVVQLAPVFAGAAAYVCFVRLYARVHVMSTLCRACHIMGGPMLTSLCSKGDQSRMPSLLPTVAEAALPLGSRPDMHACPDAPYDMHTCLYRHAQCLEAMFSPAV